MTEISRHHLEAALCASTDETRAHTIGALRIDPDGTTQATNGHVIIRVRHAEPDKEPPTGEPAFIARATVERLLARPKTQGPFTVSRDGAEVRVTAKGAETVLCPQDEGRAWPNTLALLDAEPVEGAVTVMLNAEYLRLIGDLALRSGFRDIGVTLVIPPHAGQVVDGKLDSTPITFSYTTFPAGIPVKVDGRLMPMSVRT